MVRYILDLFSGLGGFSAAFEKSDDWEVTTVDFEEQFDPDICADLTTLTADDFEKDFEVILASPPCKTFSVASMHHHWTEDRIPDTKEAEDSLELLHHTLNFIEELDPEYWWMENPRGMMRKKIGMPEGLITWCQFGANRMKPTDLWGTHPVTFEYKRCSQGDECHASAARGSQGGTQGMDSASEKAKIPFGLSKHILESIEDGVEQSTISMFHSKT